MELNINIKRNLDKLNKAHNVKKVNQFKFLVFVNFFCLLLVFLNQVCRVDTDTFRFFAASSSTSRVG